MTTSTAAVADVASDLVLRHQEAGIVRLTMNRPAQRNALSEALMAALHSGLDEAAADPAVRVIIIAAQGPAFSGGHDLKEIAARRADADRGRAYFEWLMATCSSLMQAIVTCPKPVIAQVQGHAFAAGCQLVASCDLAVASDAARFAVPGIDIGLFCSTPMVALSRNVGAKAAMEMLLTGEAVDAREAARLGLVNRAVAPDALEGETLALAVRIAAKSAAVVKTGKRAFYAQAEMGLAEAYDYCSRVMVENLLYRDSEEGIGAFIEKRTPKWEDR
jgi:enoyl-CoA hydratase/carnithine racemase